MKLKSIVCMALPLMVISIFAYLKFNSKTNRFSSLQIENIEALVGSETGEAKTCYNTITSKDGSRIMYCPLCDYIPGTSGFMAPSDTCTK